METSKIAPHPLVYVAIENDGDRLKHCEPRG